MVINPQLQRAFQLMELGRYELAEKELRGCLVQNPEDDLVNSYLAFCLMQMKRYEEAETFIKKAIALSPSHSYHYYVFGYLLFLQDKKNEAEKVARQLLEMDPYEANNFSLLAKILIDKKQYEEALERANEGLEIEPEHVDCLNLRVLALTKLGRKEEAKASIEDALENSPENSYTHANTGWSLLEQGNHQQARVHFSEALKLDPTNQYAKQGLIEALKAKNIFYRLLLKYYFWIDKQSEKNQWLFIIGMVVLVRVLRYVSINNPSLEPFIFPIIVFYMIFVYSTWISEPFFNLLLRLDPVGKNALSDKQKTASNIVGVLLLIVLVSLALYFMHDWEPWLILMVYCGFMVVPVTVYFKDYFKAGKKKLLDWWAIALGIVGLLAVVTEFAGNPISSLLTLFIIGFVGFTWAANFFSIRS